MKKDKKHIKWLNGELPLWQEKGLISPESSRQIQDLYGYQEAGFHWTVVIFAIFGALLIGGGLIMVFGHNWDLLARGVKASLAFGLVLAGQGVAAFTLWESKGTAWREGSAVFLNLALLTGLAIIGQTYQLGGNLERLLFWWMMISFPTCYLLKSRASTVIYLLVLPCCFMEFTQNNRSELVKATYFLVIGWAPILWLTVKSWISYYRRGEERLITAVSFLSIFSSLAIYHEAYYHGNIMFAILCFFCISYLFAVEAGVLNSLTLMGNPLARFTEFYIFVFMSIMTFRDAFKEIMLRDSTMSLNIVLVVLLAIYGGFMLTRKNYCPALFALYPLLVLAGMLIFTNATLAAIFMIVLNLYFGVICVSLIMKGERERRLFHVFFGMFWLSLLIFLRFIDSDLELIGKGIAFIIIGIGFLVANIFFAKRIRSAQKEVTHEA